MSPVTLRPSCASLSVLTWWRHQMETFSALLAICARNSPVPGEFPAQRPVTRSFEVFFDLHPNKRLSKQWWSWWFETPPCPLRRHRNDTFSNCFHQMPILIACSISIDLMNGLVRKKSISQTAIWSTHMCVVWPKGIKNWCLGPRLLTWF